MAYFTIIDWKTKVTAFEARVNNAVGEMAYRVHPGHKEDTALCQRPFTIPELSRAPKTILKALADALSKTKFTELKAVIDLSFKQGSLNLSGFNKLSSVFGIPRDEKADAQAKERKQNKRQGKRQDEKKQDYETWKKAQQNTEQKTEQKKSTDWTKWERVSAEERARQAENARRYREQQQQQQRRQAEAFMRSYKAPHDVLGVSRQASQDEIKAAYRKLVLVYHPDTSKLPKEEAEAKFNQVAQAYQAMKRRA